VNAILAVAIFSAGGFVGLFVGCALAMSAGSDLLDELEAAEAGIDRLRGRAG